MFFVPNKSRNYHIGASIVRSLGIGIAVVGRQLFRRYDDEILTTPFFVIIVGLARLCYEDYVVIKERCDAANVLRIGWDYVAMCGSTTAYSIYFCVSYIEDSWNGHGVLLGLTFLSWMCVSLMTLIRSTENFDTRKSRGNKMDTRMVSMLLLASIMQSVALGMITILGLQTFTKYEEKMFTMPFFVCILMLARFCYDDYVVLEYGGDAHSIGYEYASTCVSMASFCVNIWLAYVERSWSRLAISVCMILHFWWSFPRITKTLSTTNEIDLEHGTSKFYEKENQSTKMHIEHQVKPLDRARSFCADRIVENGVDKQPDETRIHRNADSTMEFVESHPEKPWNGDKISRKKNPN